MNKIWTVPSHRSRRQKCDENVLFSCFTFTGKERDEETGYSYHGARYYDPSLSGIWISVDPKADKYLGINPYAYCAWNPVKLVDPDGRDVVLSESAKKIHEKYYGKDGHEDYTRLYDKLNNDHTVLFNVKEENQNAIAIEYGANGIVYQTGNNDQNYSNGGFNVEWGEPNILHGGTSEHVLLEELFHAGQIIDGKYKTDAATSVTSEYFAKKFAVSTSDNAYNKTYDDTKNNFYGIPTEMSIIDTYDISSAKTYLKYGISVTVKDRWNQDATYLTGGHYYDCQW